MIHSIRRLKPDPLEKICLYCECEFRAKTVNQKYCSSECNNGYQLRCKSIKQLNANIDTQAILNNIKLSTGTKGAICELIVTNDLLIRGFSVFRSISPNSPCDLIATKDNLTIKIEVRTGKITSEGLFSCSKKGVYDCLAIVIPHTGEIAYCHKNKVNQ